MKRKRRTMIDAVLFKNGCTSFVSNPGFHDFSEDNITPARKSSGIFVGNHLFCSIFEV